MAFTPVFPRNQLGGSKNLWVMTGSTVHVSRDILPPPSKFDSARQNYPRDNFDGRGRLYKFSVALNIRLISNARLKLYNIYVFETTDNPRRVVTLNHLISRVLKTKITNIWFYYAENHVIILHSLKRITRLCSTIISSSTVQSFQSALRRVVTGLQFSSLM